MEVTKKTFISQHHPLTLTKKAVFSELLSTKDGKVVKKTIYQTKRDWLVWKKSVTEEIAIQNKLSQACPNHILTIKDYTMDLINHRRLLYITYDCDQSSKPLFQYISENDVPYKEQINICEKLLQIAQILHHSEYCHGNLKPGNIIYWNKKVLITDFGSPRTHYWNFTKEHTGQKEKEWRNNFLFFCPQQYLEIMNEENIDFRDEQWRNINLNDTKLRKKADIWALGIMMIQVFENNQNLSQDIKQFYGLNQQAIQLKLQKLGETKCGLISNAVQSLIIDWLDPDQVLRQFYNQKMLINQVNDNQMESQTTSSFYQIFDSLKPELQIEPGINQYHFYTKQELERLREAHDLDDKSSVRSDNTQHIEQPREIHEREGSIFKSQNLLPVDNNGLTASQQLSRFQNQPVVYEPANTKTLYPGETVVSRTGIPKPSIKLTSPNQEISTKQRKVTQLIPIEDDENQGFVDKSPNSQFDIPRDEQFQNLLPLTEPDTDEQKDTEEEKIPYQSSSEQFKFNTSNQLQIITDQKNGGIVSFGSIKSQNFELEKKSQENSMRLQQITDEHQSQKIDQWSNGKQILNQEQGQQLKEEKDIFASKKSFVSVGQILQETATLGQPKTTENLDQFQDTDKQIFKIQNKEFETNFSAYFPQTGNLEPFSDKQFIDQYKKPEKGQISNYETGKEITLEALQDSQKQDVQKPPEVLNKTELPSDKEFPPLLFENVEDDKRPDQPTKNQNNPSELKIETNNKLLEFKEKTPAITQVVPINNGPTFNELLKQTDLKNMNEEDLKTHQTVLKTIIDILNQVQEGIQPIVNINDDKSNNNQQINQLIPQIQSLNPKQQQQTLVEVQEQLDIIQQKQKVDQLFNTNEIHKNPHLLNLLTDTQLNKLKDQLKSKKDPQSQALLDQILQLQKVNDKLKTVSQKPSVSNMLKPDDLVKLNAQQLTQYKEILTELIKTTKSKPQQNQIFQQQQQIEKILEKIRLESLIEKFIDNPQSDTLLPEKDLHKLSDEQQKAYKEALEKHLPNASSRFKKAIESALIALEKIMKPINHAPQLSQMSPIKQRDLSSEGTEPQNEKDFPPQQGQGNFEWNDKAFDFEVFSFNKIICAYQKTASLYNVQQEIPELFKEISENQKKRNKDFYNRNTYGGFWKDDQPHGIGTMMEARKYGIYKGIFKQGKFMWGQVLELNVKGQLTQYIGYYHEKHQVKNAKKGEMIWYIYIQNEFQLIESYIGNFVLGYIQGNGSKTYADGSVYEGQWSKNKREGKGIYIRKTRGYYKFDGEFKNDLYHGSGIVSYDEMGKLTESGQYQNGRPVGGHELKLNKVLQKTINY